MSRSGLTSSTVRITSSKRVTSPRTTGAPIGTSPNAAAPGFRSMPTTDSPRAMSFLMSRGPMKPVAPMTSTDMARLLSGRGSERGVILSRAHDLGGEGLQRIPVVGPVAERDAEPRAAERAELIHHPARVLHRAPQIAGALGAVAGAEVTAAGLLRPRGALGVHSEIEAEVHRAQDRLRVAPLGLAPAVEHLALVLPVVGADVGAVPPVGVLGGRPERALLAAPADPDGDSRLQRLGVVGSVRHPDVLALEARAPLLGVQQQPHDLGVLLQHVLAGADRRKRVAEGLRLDVVPAGAEAAVHAPVRQVVDRRQRLGEQP